MKYTFEKIQEALKLHNYKLVNKNMNISSIITKSKLLCTDNDGYYVYVILDKLIHRKSKFRRFSNSNKYTIDNINFYLKSKIGNNFTCLSEKYINNQTELLFRCNRCGEVVKKKWINVYRKGINRTPILCPNCDGRIESLHASILKQVFMYNYPDTICEDNSCRNPITNKIMPTDIVNHRLKIAIEVQSEYHDNEYSKKKDLIKKEFWIARNFKFYALDIRDYTVLEMCRIFFNISELPSYINYDYSNKLNIKNIQNMLNKGKNIPEIANILNIDKHRIYDAIYSKKLIYPNNYQRPDCSPVVQTDLSGNIINKYKSISEAQLKSGVKASNIASCLRKKRNYSSGYYWYYLHDYDKYKFRTNRFEKFRQPIDMFDKNNKYIKSFNAIIEASKELNTNNYSIWRVAEGIRKSLLGYKFKYKK
ncbi:hypothetical protein CWE04_11865 [Thomasclavelia cocleata]|uniref:NUMOD1 domain-containing protein n=1 Tax=Thomasclavelia cocleata TaxID=69824 RepID=A0A1I0BML5_9FIRM|nr:NUMOD1 domain-containing DNA-binding protein [Thomasclavelia cocleata]MCR1960200.1 NUMOD1 domain-containing DNA-binding protein [Thomasclavelia cocleata]NDO41826.1 hypothetical protein [Thomasclavelia cocleata]PJN79898.1 hypothetical protein CWE04_11865 [Thomasclavelia cocleata]SET07509.1 NUMOD1 domain-containing protein [Thomasclavelia cocleata]